MKTWKTSNDPDFVAKCGSWDAMGNRAQQIARGKPRMGSSDRVRVGLVSGLASIKVIIVQSGVVSEAA